MGVRKAGEQCCGGFLGRVRSVDAEILQTGTECEDFMEELGVTGVGGEECKLSDIPGDVRVGGEKCVEGRCRIGARGDSSIHERESDGAQELAGVGEAGSVRGDTGEREADFTIAAVGDG